MAHDIYEVSYKMRRELYHKIFKTVTTLIMFFLIINVIVAFIIYPINCKSSSMSPDIPAGSLEFVIPFLKKPHRGQVMLFKTKYTEPLPYYKNAVNIFTRFISGQRWNLFEDESTSDSLHVRRVIGVPGDVLYIDKYVAYIKPSDKDHFLTEFELTESKYNLNIVYPDRSWDGDIGAKENCEKIVLGSDEYFVLGDNRTECTDSRVWGTLHSEDVKGSVALLFFPLNKFRIFF